MERLVTEYAVRMSKCSTMCDLKALWSEISGIRKQLGDWYLWLADIKEGNKIRLTPTDLSEHLTKEGQKYIEQQQEVK